MWLPMPSSRVAADFQQFLRSTYDIECDTVTATKVATFLIQLTYVRAYAVRHLHSKIDGE